MFLECKAPPPLAGGSTTLALQKLEYCGVEYEHL